jgi:hypothetical protein
VVNPSDPDATLDSHKVRSYQVQLGETCSPVNQTQLIVFAIPEQAHQSDSGRNLDQVVQRPNEPSTNDGDVATIDCKQTAQKHFVSTQNGNRKCLQ